MRLPTRLVLALTALALFAGLVGWVSARRGLDEVIYPASLDRMAADAETLAERLRSMAGQVRQDTALMVRLPETTAAAQSLATAGGAATEAARDELARSFAALLEVKPDYIDVRLISLSAGGGELLRVERAGPDDAIRVAPFSGVPAQRDRLDATAVLTRLPGSVYLWPIELDREAQGTGQPPRPVLRAGTALAGPDGRAAALLVVEADLAPVLEELRASVVPGLSLAVVNRRGEFLLHPGAGEPGRLQQELPELSRVLGLLGRPDRFVTSVEDAESGEVGFAAAALRLGTDSWLAVLLSAPRSQLLVEATSVLRDIGLGALAALVAVGLAVVAAALWTLRPLGRLAAAMEGIGRGEAVELPERAVGEIGVLADAFRRHLARERRYSAAVASANDAILTMTPEGVITAWNRAAERLYGYGTDEAVGSSITMLVPEDRLEEFEKVQRNFRSGQAVEAYETVRRTRDGRTVEVSLSLSPVRSAAGAVTGIAEICRDITGRKQEEARFRLAVEAAPAAMIMTDQAGRILLTNGEAERIFGYQPGELIGEPIEVLVPERFRGDHVGFRHSFHGAPGRRMMGAGRDLYGRRKDGSEFPVEIGLNPLQTSDGLVVLSVVLDITARKQEEARFRLAVEAAPAAVIMTDDAGRIVLTNSETGRIFGYEPEELVGQSIEILVPERHRGAHAGHRKVFLGEPGRRMMGAGRDLYGRRKDGSEFPVEIGLNPLETDSGMMVLSVVVDISERRAAEAALELRTRELQRSNAELQQFAYVASHDLQEPLRMVSSFCELLDERHGPKLEGEAKEFLSFAVDGARRMRRLINDLLDYSRLETRQEPLKPVSSRRALERALANLAASVRESGAEIEYGELPQVLGHEGQLAQVFQNLVANAIKFRGKAPPWIEISAARENGAWRFAVRDNGIGIDPRQFNAIFGVFQRLHSRDDYPGTGIGLAICKRIVERHGGRIWVESRPGEGATFNFTLADAGAAPPVPRSKPEASKEEHS